MASSFRIWALAQQIEGPVRGDGATTADAAGNLLLVTRERGQAPQQCRLNSGRAHPADWLLLYDKRWAAVLRAAAAAAA